MSTEIYAISVGSSMAEGIRAAIPYWKMVPDVCYVVVDPSKDQTFRAGDHVCQYSNGDISSREGCGWIDSKDVPSAAEGMTVVPDVEWAREQINGLKAQIKILEEQYFDNSDTANSEEDHAEE